MVDFITHEGVSSDFKSHMDNVMEQLSPETAAYLQSKGWEFHLVRNAVKDFADLDKTEEPNFRAIGAALEDGSLKHIYFFQRGCDPLTGDIYEDSWATPEIAAHEMGHALNGEIGYQTGVKLSDQAIFKVAHTKDVSAMVEADVDYNCYFIKTPQVSDPYARGRSETVAEMLGNQLISKRSTIGDTIPPASVFDIEVKSFGDKFPNCASLCWENMTLPIFLGQPVCQNITLPSEDKKASLQGPFSKVADVSIPIVSSPIASQTKKLTNAQTL